MAAHSSILAWRILWTEESGGLQSMGSQSWTRLSDWTHTHTYICGSSVTQIWTACPYFSSVISLLWCWRRVLARYKVHTSPWEGNSTSFSVLFTCCSLVPRACATKFTSHKPPEGCLRAGVPPIWSWDRKRGVQGLGTCSVMLPGNGGWSSLTRHPSRWWDSEQALCGIKGDTPVLHLEEWG